MNIRRRDYQRHGKLGIRGCNPHSDFRHGHGTSGDPVHLNPSGGYFRATYGHRHVQRQQHPNVTSSTDYFSSDGAVASVNSTGLVTALDADPATITASFGGRTATADIVVTDAQISSIAVTPTNPVIADGTDQQFIATATLTDGTTKTLPARPFSYPVILPWRPSLTAD